MATQGGLDQTKPACQLFASIQILQMEALETRFDQILGDPQGNCFRLKKK